MQFDLKKQIIFEDDDVLIINKPAGLVVHPDNTYKDNTLSDIVVENYPKIKSVGQEARPGIVHRLDKDTSGLIIIAKNQKSYDYLIEVFKNRRIEKKYFALVYGILKEKNGIIVYSLEKKGKVRARLSKTSKPALTRYEVIKEYGDKFSLLDVKIETGRTHQIRVHLTKIGHPIVGDQEYKFRKMEDSELKRQFLHAHYLKLRLPSGIEKEFNIDLPEDLKDFLSKL
ncbi:MAG: RluA family pseudouridine synthase [Patescibacteria group bacterium]|nr:RluA family pseudouridine synthase [Patescibacteria group bacterium]